ncbi:MAG: SpoIIE family protein phosphatase [Bacteroidales bacterium]|nr:SpoIIE family protein phosphatase [Bacteroidales bacterium]
MFWLLPVFAQNNFVFRGKVTYTNKPMNKADVLVYENGALINYLQTNSYGSFNLSLETQKKYLLEFKSATFPAQKVIISTFINDKKKKNLNPDRVTIRFPLKENAENTKKSNQNIYSFSLNDNGFFNEEKVIVKKEDTSVKDEKLDLTNEIIQKKDKIVKLDSLVEDKKDEITKIIQDLPDEDAKNADAKLQTVYAKMDSILLIAEKKGNLMLQSADLKRKEIIANAYISTPKISTIDVKKEIEKPTKDELNNIGVNDKEFYERKDIKAYQKTIANLEKSKLNSKKDSVKYLDYLVKMKEEMLKSANLKLELDKLNARTHEDRIELENRQLMISQIEQEIQNAKNKIELQQAEIKNKNLMLLFAITGLLFFVILFVVVYQNYRLKKRTNERLEQQNQEIALKNKKIIDSITYAKTIQQAILPLKSTLDKYFETFVIFQPKDIVSGDFYWFTHFEDTNTSVVAVVDCTGHGVPGAFMSMIGNRLLVEVVNESKITEPKEILEKLDAGLRQALMQDETLNNDGMDMCVCTIHNRGNSTFNVEFAGAKRPLFYAHDNEVQFIKGTVRGIGGRARLRRKGIKPFVSHNLELKKGDMLYLTTDGFLDLQSPERKKFGRKNFIDLLNSGKDKSMEDQRYKIVNALDIHRGNELQIDDITIMGIKL